MEMFDLHSNNNDISEIVFFLTIEHFTLFGYLKWIHTLIFFEVGNIIIILGILNLLEVLEIL